MNRRERRYYERKQNKIVLNKRDEIIKFLEKKFPTDEDKIAYIKKLQQELEEMQVNPDAVQNIIEEN
jgi:glutathionyl-hydroquinone reductase